MHDTQRTEIMVAADLPRSDFTVRRALQWGALFLVLLLSLSVVSFTEAKPLGLACQV